MEKIINFAVISYRIILVVVVFVVLFAIMMAVSLYFSLLGVFASLIMAFAFLFGLYYWFVALVDSVIWALDPTEKIKYLFR